MASRDHYNLRFEDFETNILTSWQEFQIDKDFYDVTLACEDKQIQTHKLIISSSSPVLRSILKQNQNPHPVIYLRGIKFVDLENLLNFIYQGEVNVAQEDLNSFLAVAKDLKIGGLSEENEKRSNSTIIPKEFSPKRKFIKNDNAENGSESERIDNENFKITEDNCKTDKKPNLENYVKLTNLETKEANLETKEEYVFSCNSCDKVFKRKDNLRTHIDSVHENISIPCNKCDKRFTTLKNMERHNGSIHEGRRYHCSQCDFKAKTNVILQKHLKRVHNLEL